MPDHEEQWPWLPGEPGTGADTGLGPEPLSEMPAELKELLEEGH